MKTMTIIAAAVLTALTLAGCSPEQSTTMTFGEVFEYEDGVTITVSAPFEYFPNANEDLPKHAVAFVLTIENGSEEALEPVVNTHVKSAGIKATQVYDIEKGIDADPQETIPPGGSITWTEVYGVEDPGSLTLTTAPNMHEYIELVFTNTF